VRELIAANGFRADVAIEQTRGEQLTGISSMATRAVLAELADTYERQSGQRVAIESVGGVDAIRRVQSGERFDFVVLAAQAIDKPLPLARGSGQPDRLCTFGRGDRSKGRGAKA
jgi:ABC-type molybdate transport system substrate-binding protein